MVFRTVEEVMLFGFSFAIFVFGLYATKFLWKMLFSPLNLKRSATIGYRKDEDGLLENGIINHIENQRAQKKFPPVYPNGWFKLLDSNMLRTNTVKSVYALGEHFAVFRNKNGVARVLDAYCPHLGADMSVGGRVFSTDCLQCPFHGWVFDGATGKCVNIPYSKKALNFVSVKSWHVQEINGIICVWYHSEGLPPQWENPRIPEISELKYVGKTEHIVNGHIQDIPENAADVAHLNFLHKPLLHRDVGKYDSVWNILQHDINAAWKPNIVDGLKHCSEMTIYDSTHALLFGRKIPIKTFIFKIKQIGPGVVHLYMDTPWMRGILIQTITPIAPLQQKLCHSYYVERKVPLFLAKLFFYFEAIQIERDIFIWNNKTYLPNPILVKEDRSISLHRRWFKQFYSENSPSVESEKLKNKSLKEHFDW